ncbi:serpentine type 7TM GPCR chemoreceptor srt domain-containing protein [Ditylenchus destructor]|nr:serpentine type 7TM GPCR chemoreceptor srt domain-containing protein [Ditylenchus destructor]
MNYYFFDHETYDRLYNCSMLTEAQWETKKRPNWIGAVHLSLGTIYQVLYLIFLMAMWQKQYWSHSCYKLMFVLGLNDLCATVIGGTFCGIFSLRGDIFCTNQKLVYLVGCCQASFWSAACITGLILLINRTLDLADDRMANKLFGGAKTYIWFLFPAGSFFYMWFYTTPFLFSAIVDASFLNPYLGVPEIKIDMAEYDNFYCLIHNYAVAAIYPFMYLIMMVLLWKKSRGGVVTSKQKQIILQSIIVSLLLAITAVTYMVMQYIPTPVYMPIIVHFLWQGSHGASVFTYVFVNKSMKKEATKIVKRFLFALHCGIGGTNTVHHISTSNNTTIPAEQTIQKDQKLNSTTYYEDQFF